MARLDAAYRDRPPFVILKARLLAAFALLVLVFTPLNVAKMVLIHTPALIPGLALNVVIAIASVVCLRSVLHGRLEGAGNGLGLTMSLGIHVTVVVLAVANHAMQSMSVAIQTFVFDVVFILFAVVFASRKIATFIFALSVVGLVSYYRLVLQPADLGPEGQTAAGTLLREGLFALGFLFSLGITLARMIDSAQRRSEESLRLSHNLNENLERLVSERTHELETVSRDARAASQAKSEFLANMSHEIRTPLNGIIASVDLMVRRPDLRPETREQARLIAESGELLLKLLSDILDFSKIEAGQVVLEKHTFDLAATVNDVVRLMTHRAAEGSVRLESAMAPELGRFFEGDSYRLRQILLNLLSNAVKFTPANGRVKVSVTSSAAETRARAEVVPVRFEIQDTGIGMDEATTARLFERFTQADSSTTRRYGGTGLGLAISHRLVELMGGRLEVISAPGKGSRFFFTLRLRSTAVAPTTTSDHPLPETRLGLRVLVAEDNPINQKIIAAQLRQLDCELSLAADGQAALDLLEREPLPDVILMDCHMPILDGWETTRRIRAWSASSQPHQQKAAAIPVIALTASAYPEERARCREVGMNDFVTKPFKLAELQRALQPYVAARHSVA